MSPSKNYIFVLSLMLMACTTAYHDFESTASLTQSNQSGNYPTSSISFSDFPAINKVRLLGDKSKVAFPRFGQCQINFPLTHNSNTGLSIVPKDYEAIISKCVDLAVREKINVLIFPELAVAFSDEVRNKIFQSMKMIADRNDIIIIAGSFYDQQRYNRIAVISKDGIELGFKIRPSRYEASPSYGKGMTPGSSLLLLDTPYGRLAVVTCVDLISDAVQYILRNLATLGEIDAIININYNPKAWEFLIEANGIARRHPVFVSITNVSGSPEGPSSCIKNNQPLDNGSCYGNSAVFANIRMDDKSCPNCFKAIEGLIGNQFKVRPDGPTATPYDAMIANVPIYREAVLTYELNIRMKQEPLITNAPDQGYPTIRNVRVMYLDEMR